MHSFPNVKVSDTIKSTGGKNAPTCPNPACKRTFSKPLKTLNLQDDSTEPYDACPYCLTKIQEMAVKNERRPVFQKKPEPEAKPSASKDKPEDCKHYLGYLSMRSQKEQIPEECLVCKKTVECMLMKMH